MRTLLLGCAVMLMLANGVHGRPEPVPQPSWSPDMQTVADANNAFTFDLFAKLYGQPGNQFFSPASIHAALTMAADGAKGVTQEQMAKVLRLPADRAKWLAAGDLGKYYTRPGKPYELAVANSLWGQKGFSWKPEFLARQKGRFGAALEEVDFGNTAAALQRINKWTSDNTRGKIPEILCPSDVTPLTRFLLVNAIYFKSDWQTKFVKAATADAPFLLADGQKVNVPLMHQESEYHYAETEGLQLLELPYKGGDMSMVVILPRKPDGLPAIEKLMTTESLKKWMAPAHERLVRVWLPRFRVEVGFSLGDALAGLGMTAAFDSKIADFTGMAGEKVAISKVIHKAFVDVNEEGTEAAAATAIAGNAPSPAPPTPVDFRADRPFLFIIRDVQHGTILFMGRMANPKG